MPGTELVPVDDPLRPRRTAAFVLVGLAVSGWIGFLALAGVLLGTRTERSLVAGTDNPQQRAEPMGTAASKPVSTAARNQEARPQLLFEPRRISILTRYEERRRIQERVREADVADHQNGSVAAARQIYAHAAAKGWAPAALALAFTYDPHELRRRGVNIPASADKARACYIKARKLMEAAVAYYLSRLPPGNGATCGA